MEHNKINNEVMRRIADQVRDQLPGCGFAIVAFDMEDAGARGNYISNVQDDFMIQTLEHQIRVLKQRSADSTEPKVSSEEECL